MPIPDFQEITLPLLKLSGDQNDHTLPETEEALANFFQLTQEERVEMLPSGTQRRFANRVAWAKVYVTKETPLSSNIPLTMRPCWQTFAGFRTAAFLPFLPESVEKSWLMLLQSRVACGRFGLRLT